jgi:hypothetical protein
MPKASVVILHGWSDQAKSFKPLRKFLGTKERSPGVPFAVEEVWLGDYISMDDDVRVEDVAKRMQAVIADLLKSGDLSSPFDMIVHSTGALVAREWLATFYPEGVGADGKPCPLKRLVMLAPANFGSKLAAVGKSMIGRLTKGLTNRLETGEQMLRALELASPYQWKLSRRDLLGQEGDQGRSPFGPDKVWPFVLIGSRAYDEGLQQVVNECGSDGTVRVAAGNINCVGMTIDFSAGGAPVISPWVSRMGMKAPLAVLPERDHSEITHPEQHGDAFGIHGKRLGDMLVEALRCDSFASYRVIEEGWRKISNETAMLALTPAEAAAQAPLEDTPVEIHTIPDVFGGLDRPKAEHFHRYLQLNVFVRDDYGNPVDDYFLEFKGPAGDQKSLVTFHKEVLEAVHNNSRSGAYRCLYIDHTDLMRKYYNGVDVLTVSLTATPPGRNIRYFDSANDHASGQLPIHAADADARDALKARLFRNQTHFIEVIIPRRGVEKVFALSNR